MSDHEIEAAKRLLERHNYKVIGPHEGEWAPDPRDSQWTDDDDTAGERAVRNALGLCGCGQPDRVAGLVAECLAAIKTTQDLIRAAAPDYMALLRGPLRGRNMPQQIGILLVAKPDVAGELVAQFLDSAGCLEHGSSVNWAWLSKKGEWLLEQLTKEAT